MTRQTQIWSNREGGVGTDDSSNPDMVLGSPYLEMERQANNSLLQIWTERVNATFDDPGGWSKF